MQTAHSMQSKDIFDKKYAIYNYIFCSDREKIRLIFYFFLIIQNIFAKGNRQTIFPPVALKICASQSALRFKINKSIDCQYTKKNCFSFAVLLLLFHNQIRMLPFVNFIH